MHFNISKNIHQKCQDKSTYYVTESYTLFFQSVHNIRGQKLFSDDKQKYFYWFKIYALYNLNKISLVLFKLFHRHQCNTNYYSI